MLCEKIIRTLICYAGSASEASIGSKPIGSELKLNLGMMGGGSQGCLPAQARKTAPIPTQRGRNA
ncbi:hypothetical protein MTBSS4_250005 [Magnetospirillum sp. SS-4]|nr:hypothetical protein MTBSS4_250005 [Magnetospirillum sp. SS-4]